VIFSLSYNAFIISSSFSVSHITLTSPSFSPIFSAILFLMYKFNAPDLATVKLATPVSKVIIYINALNYLNISNIPTISNISNKFNYFNIFYIFSLSNKLEILNVVNIQYVWESLKTMNVTVDGFETCVDFGLTFTDAQKLAQKWKNQRTFGAGL
jgi:hypothetical protein